MALFFITDSNDESAVAVLLEKSEKLLNFLKSIKEFLDSTTSLAISGFICEVLVNWGCPKSIISSQ